MYVYINLVPFENKKNTYNDLSATMPLHMPHCLHIVHISYTEKKKSQSTQVSDCALPFFF